MARRSRWLVGSSRIEQIRRRLTRKDACQARAQFLPAAERPGHLQGIVIAEAEPGEGGMGCVGAEAGIQPVHVVEDRLAGHQQADMLVQQGDIFGEAGGCASGGLKVSRDEAEQGGFARSVRPGDGDPFRTGQLEVERTEQVPVRRISFRRRGTRSGIGRRAGRKAAGPS
jgi:hypothetical protein